MLDRQFRDIAKSLVESWQVLSCFISAGQNGRVCWTFGKKKSKPAPTPPTPQKGRNVFFGLNGTLGIPILTGVGANLKIGADFAWPLSDNFAIGAYTNIGGGGFVGSSSGGTFDFKVGLLMLAGDVNDRPFIIGIAPCTGYGFGPVYNGATFELRFGRAIREHLYITGNLNMYIGNFAIEPGVTVGYYFGDRFQTY